jgi:hypothetical protein
VGTDSPMQEQDRPVSDWAPNAAGHGIATVVVRDPLATFLQSRIRTVYSVMYFCIFWNPHQAPAVV